MKFQSYGLYKGVFLGLHSLLFPTKSESDHGEHFI